MTLSGYLHKLSLKMTTGRWLLLSGLLLTTTIYWPGLSGGFLFDDYPNIVDNPDLHPHNASFTALLNAALSSPASDFKRPLASLSFAANFLLTGLDPYWMKLTNLVIHLLNGWLVYLLAKQLLTSPHPECWITENNITVVGIEKKTARINAIAALVASCWLVLPINLTAVLYTVQRMESMANLFVLIGLLGYLKGRHRMLEIGDNSANQTHMQSSVTIFRSGFSICVFSLIFPLLIGILAKETIVLLPLYAFAIEWVFFQFKMRDRSLDKRIPMLFFFVLFLPAIAGTGWLLPRALNPSNWQTRNFTLGTRLLSETRVVVDYVMWTILPTPHALSFYHDDFQVSTNLLTPWTTLACLMTLLGMVVGAVWLRSRLPLVALGLLLFLGAQLLTCTIIPLELVYEHRNYFASFGLLLALVPILAGKNETPFALTRWTLLIGLALYWSLLTAATAYSWGNPIRLAEELAQRAPLSPRAQYELGRTYIIYSHYEPTSIFTKLAYEPLEKAAKLPGSSILPEQALIFMNARMHLPLKNQWWQSMITKLKNDPVGVQDESSLGALTQCMRDGGCDLPKERMLDAYLAAVSNHKPSARLLAMYADFAWNILEDRSLGLRLAYKSTEEAPNEPAYHITLARMLIACGEISEAKNQVAELRILNLGGRLNSSIAELNNALSHSN